jgi:AmmeMemoRadiSam system protein B
MKTREASLPRGWYPREKNEISHFLSEFAGNSENRALAAVAPHAGWFYSGKIAARAVSSLRGDIDTLVIIGGHLPAGYPALFALEDAVSTPLGVMPIDTGLRSALMREIGGQEDRYRDNTVEVLLPMAHYFFPDARLLWVRLPADLSAYEAGKTLSAISVGRSIAVIASTDLTHYGPNYDYAPKGCGWKALDWVREVNDRNFIQAVESGDPAAVLERAQADYSSCSAGAVLGAMGFALGKGLGPARLLEYGTSADTEKNGIVPDSFVGYAAMLFDMTLPCGGSF